MENIVLPTLENTPIEVFAEMLNMDVEDVYDLTPEQLTALTIQYAEDKKNEINQILDNRNVAHTTITTAQKEYGITKDDLSILYFDQIKELK